MLSGRRTAVLVALAALLLLLVGGRMLAELLVDLLWYRSIGLEDVFWLRWVTGMLIRAAAALLIGAVVYANLWYVSRSLGTLRVRRRFGNIEIAEQLPGAYVTGVLLLISLFSAWWLSAALADPFRTLAALRPTGWGVRDPIHGLDLSFYVFVLPLLETVQSLLGVLIVWCALLAAAAYISIGALSAQGGRIRVSPGAGRHLRVLLAAFLVVIAIDYLLDRYGLVIGGSGVGDSFGYTDAHARLLVKGLLCALALLAAAAVAFGGRRWGTRTVPAALLALGLGIALGEVAYPLLLQKLVVEPNEFPRERPYIEHHIALTRRGYALDSVRPLALPYERPGRLSPAEVREALAGVPLWDERPLLTAYEQRQSIVTYYDFLSVHADRYGPPGAAEQVAIAVRELNPSDLPPTAQTWQNLHLTYVSGKGAVVTPAARIADDGAPEYFLSDLDPPRVAPDAPEEVALTEPNVYIGERGDGYVVLDREGGPRGVPLDAAWKRLVFAWAFQSRNLFLSGAITPDSRIVYRRSVLDRARAAAPFLIFDRSTPPQPVVFQGRVVWLVDGYTASESLPLSRLSRFLDRQVRYARNPAKVVVDGVSGTVEVYALSDEPILAAYSRILPGMVKPIEEMPAELRRHLRYPAALLGLQAQILGEYHMSDPRAFYEKEDAWTLATETYRAEMIPSEPAYSTIALPGEGSREFVLSVPLVARGRRNLTALLVARNDPPHYGEQLLYQLPRDQQVPGPQQIEAMVDQDPEISQELSLWRQGGSDVIRGHLMVVPVDSTLVYLEPLFLEAESGAIPQLERVIVAHAGGVAMRPTLASAVGALLGVAGGEEPEGEGEPEGAEREPAATAAGAVGQGGGALRNVRALFERAEGQLRAGDWAGFGRTWEQIREALRAAESAPGGTF